MFKSHIVATSVLNGGLYRLTLTEYVLVHTKSDNSSVMSPYTLWHRRLGHFSKERMKRLEQDGKLQSIPDSFGSLVEWIKGKFTKSKRK